MLFLFYNVIFTSFYNVVFYQYNRYDKIFAWRTAIITSPVQDELCTGRHGQEYHDWFLQFSACVSENKFLPSSFV